MILECCNAHIMAGLFKGMEAVLLFHKLHLKVLRPRPGSLPGHVLLHTQPQPLKACCLSGLMKKAWKKLQQHPLLCKIQVAHPSHQESQCHTNNLSLSRVGFGILRKITSCNHFDPCYNTCESVLYFRNGVFNPNLMSHSAFFGCHSFAFCDSCYVYWCSFAM